MEYGIKPETTQENELELYRMEQLAKQWNMPYSVYKGKTNDIDLHLTWYCPHCLVRLNIGRVVVHNGCAVHESYKHSKMDHVYEMLCCPSRHEVCDYSFWNKDLRRSAPSFWSSDFLYPLNPMQLHQRRIDMTKKAILHHQSEIERHKALIAEQKEKLSELEIQPSELCFVDLVSSRRKGIK